VLAVDLGYCLGLLSRARAMGIGSLEELLALSYAELWWEFQPYVHDHVPPPPPLAPRTR
jgi:hypothetical protein